MIGSLFFRAPIILASFFDKMEAPRGAMRQYNADELERLSHVGLEALLLKVQDGYHLREDEGKLCSLKAQILEKGF